MGISGVWVAMETTTDFRNHAHDKTLLLNAVRLYSLVILKDLAFEDLLASDVLYTGGLAPTRVDQLLSARLPALVLFNLGLYFRDLETKLDVCAACTVGYDNCLRSLRARPR